MNPFGESSGHLPTIHDYNKEGATHFSTGTIFDTAATRWLNVTELIALLTVETTPLTISTSPPLSPPSSGTLILYDRNQTRNYKYDKYEWIKKKNSNKIREDHVKLRVGGIYRVAGCYVHHATIPTFHRRAYNLLDPGSGKGWDPESGGLSNLVQTKAPFLVLVHYLDTHQASIISARITDNLGSAACKASESVDAATSPYDPFQIQQSANANLQVSLPLSQAQKLTLKVSSNGIHKAASQPATLAESKSSTSAAQRAAKQREKQAQLAVSVAAKLQKQQQSNQQPKEVVNINLHDYLATKGLRLPPCMDKQGSDEESSSVTELKNSTNYSLNQNGSAMDFTEFSDPGRGIRFDEEDEGAFDDEGAFEDEDNYNYECDMDDLGCENEDFEYDEIAANVEAILQEDFDTPPDVLEKNRGQGSPQPCPAIKKGHKNRASALSLDAHTMDILWNMVVEEGSESCPEGVDDIREAAAEAIDTYLNPQMKAELEDTLEQALMENFVYSPLQRPSGQSQQIQSESFAITPQDTNVFSFDTAQFRSKNFVFGQSNNLSLTSPHPWQKSPKIRGKGSFGGGKLSAMRAQMERAASVAAAASVATPDQNSSHDSKFDEARFEHRHPQTPQTATFFSAGAPLPEIVDFTPEQASIPRTKSEANSSKVVLSVTSTLPETPLNTEMHRWTPFAVFVEIVSSGLKMSSDNLIGSCSISSPLKKLTPFSYKCCLTNGIKQSGVRHIVLLGLRTPTNQVPDQAASNEEIRAALQFLFNPAHRNIYWNEPCGSEKSHLLYPCQVGENIRFLSQLSEDTFELIQSANCIDADVVSSSEYLKEGPQISESVKSSHSPLENHDFVMGRKRDVADANLYSDDFTDAAAGWINMIESSSDKDRGVSSPISRHCKIRFFRRPTSVTVSSCDLEPRSKGFHNEAERGDDRDCSSPKLSIPFLQQESDLNT